MSPPTPGWRRLTCFIGATALPDDDPRNKVHPGEFNYGGGHVIEELVAGKDITAGGHRLRHRLLPAEEAGDLD